MPGKWVVVHDEAEHLKAVAVANGCYRMHLVLGIEALSGSTLTGSRRRNYKRYLLSRDKLLEALRAAGVVFSVQKISRRDTLVFGDERSR